MSDQTGTSKKADNSTGTCRSFPAATKRTVALAIKLSGATAKNSHEIISKVLEDEKVQAKLHAELKKAGEALMAEQAKGNKVTLGQSIGAVGAATAKSLKDPLIKEVKKSKEYKRLEQGLSEFKCSFDQSPVGVFYNENKNLVIIVAVVGAIGAGAAMYYTKSGDLPAKAFSLLPALTPIKLGSVELSVSKFDFKPSERKFDATVGVGGKWKAIKAKLEVSVAFKNDKLVAAGSKTDVSLTLNPRSTVFATAKGSWAEAKDDAPEKIKGRADVGLKQRVSERVNLQIQLYGEFDQNEKSRTSQVGLGLSSKIARPLGKDSSLSVTGTLGTGTHQHRVDQGFTPTQPDHRVTFGFTLRFP